MVFYCVKGFSEQPRSSRLQQQRVRSVFKSETTSRSQIVCQAHPGKEDGVVFTGFPENIRFARNWTSAVSEYTRDKKCDPHWYTQGVKEEILKA